MLRSPQSDFSFLTATAWHNDGHGPVASSTSDLDSSTKTSRKRHIDERGHSKETFLPLIPDLTGHKLRPSKDVTISLASVVDSLDTIDCEPIRRVLVAAPPKRFYRTFWCSIARRLLQGRQIKQVE